MADQWECSFRVGTTQDKDARYAEVLSSVNIPTSCTGDVQTAHDQVWADFAVNGEPIKPYAVYMNGFRDTNTGAFAINTSVDTNA